MDCTYQYPLSTTLVPAPTSGFPARPVRVLFESVRVGPHLELEPALGMGEAVWSEAHNALLVGTAEGTLAVHRLKVQGKPGRDAREWWRGYRDRADPRGRLHFA